MSMYQEFTQECTTYTVCEGKGFFFSYLSMNGVFFIKNLYISPEYRGTTLLLKTIKIMLRLAKRDNCKYIVGDIQFINPHYEKWMDFCNGMDCSMTGGDIETRVFYSVE